MNDQHVAALSDLSSPILELPGLVVDPVSSLGPVELVLVEDDILRRLVRCGVEEDASAGGADDRRLVEVLLFGERREEVTAVGRVWVGVELELTRGPAWAQSSSARRYGEAARAEGRD